MIRLLGHKRRILFAFSSKKISPQRCTARGEEKVSLAPDSPLRLCGSTLSGLPGWNQNAWLSGKLQVTEGLDQLAQSGQQIGQEVLALSRGDEALAEHEGLQGRLFEGEALTLHFPKAAEQIVEPIELLERVVDFR